MAWLPENWGVPSEMNWFCCQLGAREHYAVPRALHRNGRLLGLFTDAWIRPGYPLGILKRSLRERYHDELAEATVTSANTSLLAFEAWARARGLTGWNRIMSRNEWFQSQALRRLSAICHLPSASEKPTLFSYSYTALEPFRFAKSRRWKTVLGQIDPGPEMGRIADELGKRNGANASIQGPPENYWHAWRQECQLADRIVVNSQWSRECLMREKIPEGKISVVPLAFEQPAAVGGFVREVPERFTAERPLRILFLGQIIFLKGILPLLEAIEILQDAPIELSIVGPELCVVPAHYRQLPRVRWYGSVSRAKTSEFYKHSDVFIFPTFCDGFGLTQLEAQAWKLPVIASRCCGEVVEYERNGLLLDEPSATNIAAALQRLLAEPGLLKRLSAASGVDRRFSLESLASALIEKT
jgi:glycosyltransferase involved in cell wall biosynthesis